MCPLGAASLRRPDVDHVLFGGPTIIQVKSREKRMMKEDEERRPGEITRKKYEEKGRAKRRGKKTRKEDHEREPRKKTRKVDKERGRKIPKN